MSGGYWNYAGRRLRDILESIGQDDEAKQHWPLTCAFCDDVALGIQDIEQEMDYDLSGDTKAHRTDEQMLGHILDVLLKVAPDEWFPRGKWATIQAVQGRALAGKEKGGE